MAFVGTSQVHLLFPGQVQSARALTVSKYTALVAGGIALEMKVAVTGLGRRSCKPFLKQWMEEQRKLY